jgi:hypothetical protein
MGSQVKRLKQWDDQWGDYPYASSTLAASGCGPTCFAMIAQYYSIHITPPAAADFAIINGFYPTQNGTSWDFFAAAGLYFGIPIQQTNNPSAVFAALSQGIPCIGAHGPGEFTQYGHFIVYSYLTPTHEVMVSDPKRDDTCKLYPWHFLVQDNANSGYVAFVPSPKIRIRQS